MLFPDGAHYKLCDIDEVRQPATLDDYEAGELDSLKKALGAHVLWSGSGDQAQKVAVLRDRLRAQGCPEEDLAKLSIRTSFEQISEY
jgi:hypothetical protein